MRARRFDGTILGVPSQGDAEVVKMMTLRDRLNDCLYLLVLARLAGDDDAVRRHCEHRAVLVKQIAGMRTHLRLV